MALYIVVATSTIVRNRPALNASKRGDLKKGKQIEIEKQEGAFGFTSSPILGWVSLGDLMPAEAPPAPVEGPNLYRALNGHKRPDIGWLDINIGSFDIIPLLPSPKTQKGESLTLSRDQVDAIRQLNPDGGGYTARQKWNWLVDIAGGTRDVMSFDEGTGKYRIPVPGISGGALVNVLGITNRFALIETLTDDIPDELPDYLVFTWYAFTKRDPPILYTPYGGVRFPVLFSQPQAYVPLDWLVKV
jgi:hypothetical protein